MKIGEGQRKLGHRPDVAMAGRIVAWNKADPATRGAHPTAATTQRTRTPWRTPSVAAPSDFTTVLRVGRAR